MPSSDQVKLLPVYGADIKNGDFFPYFVSISCMSDDNSRFAIVNRSRTCFCHQVNYFFSIRGFPYSGIEMKKTGKVRIFLAGNCENKTETDVANKRVITCCYGCLPIEWHTEAARRHLQGSTSP
jgi:hypothetical protein